MTDDKNIKPRGDTPIEGPNRSAEKSVINRRKFLTGLFAGAIVAGVPSFGSANEPDTQRSPAGSVDRWANESEFMNEKEIETMQKAQETIFEHYLNPTFIVHINKIQANISDNPVNNIDKSLKIAMEYPHELKYIQSNDNFGNVIKIKKRLSSEEANVPNDFSIIIENGFITRVGNTNLTIHGRRIPWMTGEKLEKRIMDEGETYENFIKIHPGEIYEAYKDLPADVKDMFVATSIELPRRIMECIKSRNASGQIDPPIANEQIINELLNTEPKTLEEAVKNKIALKLFIITDPYNPGTYHLMYFDVESRRTRTALIVNLKGYIMNEKNDGSCEINSFYKYDENLGSAGRLKDRYKAWEKKKRETTGNTP